MVKDLLEKYGLKIIEVQTNDINGGSFAITAAKKESAYACNDAVINWMLNQEKRMGLDTPQPYLAFAERMKAHKENLNELIHSLVAAGKTIFGYGASTKGNVLLQYCNITAAELPYIAEVNENKFGSYTPGTLIPIISESEAKLLKPHYFLVLHWRFWNDILTGRRLSGKQGESLYSRFLKLKSFKSFRKEQRKYNENSSYNGCNRRHYLADLFWKKAISFMELRRSSLINTDRIDHLLMPDHQYRNNFVTHYGDLTDSSNVTRIIQQVQPDEIYDLAAQSHVKVSFETPEYTANADGIGTLRLLEAIRLLDLVRKTKIYQASTSELYGLVQEVPRRKQPPFPRDRPTVWRNYMPIGSLLITGKLITMFACNGILFNHESPYREKVCYEKGHPWGG